MADRIGYRFLDTDTLIEQVSGMSIPNIFETAGESGFRTIESQVLDQVAPFTRLVIATGGGIVLKPENWSYLRQGVVAWIEVPLEELERRLQGNQSRPLLQRSDWPQYLAALMAERRSKYAQADIHLTVAAGESTDVLCDRLIELLEARILPPQHNPPAAEG